MSAASSRVAAGVTPQRRTVFSSAPRNAAMTGLRTPFKTLPMLFKTDSWGGLEINTIVRVAGS